MSCSRCGNPAAYTVHNCPTCNPGAAKPYTPENAGKDRQAGYDLGYAATSGVFWLFTNRYLSLFWFWLIWVIATYSTGQRLGYVSDDWMERPFALDLFGFFLPIVILIAFRQHIPRIMRWVWLGLVMAVIGLLVFGD